MTIAKIIVDQIKTIDPMSFGAWGVRAINSKDRGIYFKTTGMVRWKGTVEIVLNGNDLYDIRFLRVRAGKIIIGLPHERCLL